MQGRAQLIIKGSLEADSEASSLTLRINSSDVEADSAEVSTMPQPKPQLHCCNQKCKVKAHMLIYWLKSQLQGLTAPGAQIINYTSQNPSHAKSMYPGPGWPAESLQGDRHRQWRCTTSASVAYCYWTISAAALWSTSAPTISTGLLDRDCLKSMALVLCESCALFVKTV